MIGTVEREYDSFFRVSRVLVNGGDAVSYSYDYDGLVQTAGQLSINYGWTHSLPLGTTLGPVETSTSYSGFGEPSSFSATYNGGGIFRQDYVRDRLGRITRKVESVNGVQVVYDYGYDTAGRLVDVTRDGLPVSGYSYDSNGNRLSGTVEGITSDGVYDAQDRMISYGNATYTYTANGELLTKTEGGQTTSYDYDVFGNLRGVSMPDGTQIEYVIDGANRRVGKKVNGTLAQGFLYKDQLNPIAELDGAGNVVSLFVYGSRMNVPDYMVRGGVTYRIISDHLGSPRMVINTADGTIIQRMEYDEFGNITFDTNPGFQPFGFAGGLYDGDTGLTRFGARDYDPSTGRWTSKDPIRFTGGDTNLFGYVLSDPVNLVDMDGLLTITLDVAIGAYAGGMHVALSIDLSNWDVIFSSGAGIGVGFGTSLTLGSDSNLSGMNTSITLSGGLSALGGKITVVTIDRAGNSEWSWALGIGLGLGATWTIDKTVCINCEVEKKEVEKKKANVCQ